MNRQLAAPGGTAAAGAPYGGLGVYGPGGTAGAVAGYGVGAAGLGQGWGAAAPAGMGMAVAPLGFGGAGLGMPSDGAVGLAGGAMGQEREVLLPQTVVPGASLVPGVVAGGQLWAAGAGGLQHRPVSGLASGVHAGAQLQQGQPSQAAAREEQGGDKRKKE